MPKIAGRPVRRLLIGVVVAACAAFSTIVVAAPAQAVSYTTIFAIAKGQIGTVEGTAAADKYFNQPGLGSYRTATTPWCAAFVTWVSWMAGASTFKSVSVGSWVAAAGAHKAGLYLESGPHAGDLVAYDWDANGTWDHMGIVTSVNGSKFWTIEGNTSNPNGGRDGVFAKPRSTGSAPKMAYINLANP